MPTRMMWSGASVTHLTMGWEDLGSIPTQDCIFGKLSSPFFLTMDLKAYSCNIIVTCNVRFLLSQINLCFVWFKFNIDGIFKCNFYKRYKKRENISYLSILLTSKVFFLAQNRKMWKLVDKKVFKFICSTLNFTSVDNGQLFTFQSKNCYCWTLKKISEKKLKITI